MIEPIHVGQGKKPIYLLPQMANRHGLIAGATGTGKTVTLQTLAEGFSRRGVPVFLADVKGDLAGMSQPGGNNPKIVDRAKELRMDDYKGEAFPVVFWDVFGEQGHPVRATISEMGPLLLGRLLNLNETQEGVLNIVFKIADEAALLLLDLKDLRSMLQQVADNAKDFTTEYGNISAASAGSIQRSLLALESQGGDKFFGEPALDLNDLIQTDQQGRGVINILAAEKLMQQSPKVYATFLLWLLSELFETLPEIGDPEKPKLVFFFDEAHLLFADIEPHIREKVEQMVRLIRSKGVGVYFISQNPLDIPDVVLGQLGNRVQHALRAFTPRDQRAVQAAATTFRQNPKLKVEVLTELAVGEALVSMLDETGSPTIVERAKIVPPRSQLGAITPQQRQREIQSSVLAGHYEKTVDRESAYEKLQQRGAEKVATQPTASAGAPAPPGQGQAGGSIFDKIFEPTIGPRGGRHDTLATSMVKSVVRSAGTQIGREIMRGLLGGILGGGMRRR